MAELPANHMRLTRTDETGEPTAPPSALRLEPPVQVPGMPQACASLGIAYDSAVFDMTLPYWDVPDDLLAPCPEGCGDVFVSAHYSHPRRDCYRGRHIFDGKAGRRRLKKAKRNGRLMIDFFSTVVKAIREGGITFGANGIAIGHPMPVVDRAAYRRRVHRRTGRR